MPTVAELIAISKENHPQRKFSARDKPARQIDRWALSIDLGKLNDNSAMSLINYVVTGTGEWTTDPRTLKTREREHIFYRALDMHKIPLQTPYSQVAKDTRAAL